MRAVDNVIFLLTDPDFFGCFFLCKYHNCYHSSFCVSLTLVQHDEHLP